MIVVLSEESKRLWLSLRGEYYDASVATNGIEVPLGRTLTLRGVQSKRPDDEVVIEFSSNDKVFFFTTTGSVKKTRDRDYAFISSDGGTRQLTLRTKGDTFTEVKYIVPTPSAVS